MTHRKGSKPDHRGEQWIPTQVDRLENLAGKNTPTGLIADALGRTEDAVRSKASEEGISLKPVNRSPYNRRGG